MTFPILDRNNAPPDSAPILDRVSEHLGFVPNLIGVLAASPPAVASYVLMADALRMGALSAVEQQVVAITVSVENECGYCVAAHSAGAHAAGLPEGELCELRDARPLEDARLEALRGFTQALVRERGLVEASELEVFLDAGFTRGHVLEVITILAHKTLSNYANDVARTPLDSRLDAHAWEPAAAQRNASSSGA